MRLIVDGKEYWFNGLDKLMNVEFIAIERLTGLSVMEFEEKLEQGSMLAITALVWVIRKRTEPSLKFDDVEFEAGSVDLKADDEDPEPEGKANTETDSIVTE